MKEFIFKYCKCKTVIPTQMCHSKENFDKEFAVKLTFKWKWEYNEQLRHMRSAFLSDFIFPNWWPQRSMRISYYNQELPSGSNHCLQNWRVYCSDSIKLHLFNQKYVITFVLLFSTHFFLMSVTACIAVKLCTSFDYRVILILN
jgi:hypothetical protein